MAVSVSSPHPPPHQILSPLRLTARTNLAFSPPSSFSSGMPIHRRQSLVVYASHSRNGLVSEQKRELFQRYGLDPNDYLTDQTSPKLRRRKELQKGDKGKRGQVPVEEPKPPRETHKMLQVLGGKARRKKLISPKGLDVRPMMEVVKGAAFDILQSAGGCPTSLRPGHWLDLYSGTGSVGIEALSRGCSEVHFVEMDPWVISDVLRPNLELTGFLEVSIIHTLCVEIFLEQAQNVLDGPFDYISVTPPYMEVNYGVLMEQISKSSVVGGDTFIVVEYPLRTEMLDSCGCLVKEGHPVTYESRKLNDTERSVVNGPTVWEDTFGNLWTHVGTEEEKIVRVPFLQQLIIGCSWGWAILSIISAWWSLHSFQI